MADGWGALLGGPRPRRAVRPRRLAAAALALAWASCLPQAAGRVDCTQSPDCASLRRQPCDPFGEVPNACGNCISGAQGGLGPTNTLCLSNYSCAAIFAGYDQCPTPVTTSSIPMLVPFGSCVCDDGDGLRWRTARGRCAKVEVAASGYYWLRRCTTRTCEPESCSDLTSWRPLFADNIAGQFACDQVGSDSIYLADSCESVLGNLPDRALCGHPGYLNGALDDNSRFLVNCALSPECPHSVEGFDALEDTCCNGHPYSFLMQNGQSTGVRAPGFCKPPEENRPSSLVGIPIEVTIIQGRGFADTDSEPGMGKSDIFCTCEIPGKPATRFSTIAVDDSLTPVWNRKAEIRDNAEGDTLLFRCYDQDFGSAHDELGSAILTANQLNQSEFEGEVAMLQGGETEVGYLTVRVQSALVVTAFNCAVQTVGPGWTGCSCLDGLGQPWADKVCTVRCVPPNCNVPEGGIPPTPLRWQTSELPLALRPNDRSTRITSSRARARPALLWPAWLAAALLSVARHSAA